ncbi:Acyl transferase/acyl hydrolase/lysophospholipase [Penicillium fimorum]|uniref:Acyl transferase/acyl hydrolase/lysophospholipase n=1 Tax=Penicillium fimorum TaxID=1882269 RepID=A0A9W9XM40_9EURO|nr:Acyl transferase/acyl hydrolase/lysophospholipase [Penicillium fimorum]
MNTYLEEMARIVGQFSHRFPHMNILEIGSGTGGATGIILQCLNGAFSSYTYTDISSGFFEKAKEKFAEHRSHMIFKVCNIEKSPAEQGYVEGSYDLVIASLALHATRNIGETMQNARKLSPCVEANVWEKMMQKTGFSGITSHTPHNSSFPLPLAVIACQAVDDKVSFLREPLLSSNESLGGDIFGDELDESVSLHCKEIRHIDGLDEAAAAELHFSGTVVFLADLLDESTFKRISFTQLKALQDIFNQSKNILWATCGAQADSPYKNMFIGLQRSVTLELTHVRSQVLGFATPSEINFDFIVRKLLQLDANSVWDEKSQLKDILWYNEPEIRIEKQQVTIPRIRISPARNNRYNSSRKLLTRDVNVKNTSLFIMPQDSKFVVKESRRPIIPASEALSSAIRVTGKSKAFISLGEASQNGSVVQLSGFARPRTDWMYHCYASV